MTLAPPSWHLAVGNPPAIRMFEASDEDDFTSRPPWEYSPQFQPDGRPSADAAKQCIETAMRDSSHCFEWLRQRLSGEEFPATVLLTRMGVAGTAVLQATVRGISEARQAEAERARLEEQHCHVQKMQAIGELAGGIAHAFNNLLTVINSYAGCAADDLRDAEPLKSDLKHILEAGHRAAMLTRQLLPFSRNQVLEPGVLVLNELIDELKDMLRRLIGEHIEFATTLAPHSVGSPRTTGSSTRC